MKKLLFLFSSLLLFAACGPKQQKIYVSNIDLNINVVRFDQDFFSLPTDSLGLSKKLPELREKYSSFFELYNRGIIGIGESTSPDYIQHLPYFFRNEAVQAAWRESNKIFTDAEMAKVNAKLTNAFKQYRYYFPEAYIPEFYTYISGFNQSMALADSLIGIGLDKYLGTDYEGYARLGISRYLTLKMYPEKIVPDCVYAWGVGEFPMTGEAENNLISKMVYEGKLLYFVKQMMPAEADTTIFGFTHEQLKWCENNEKAMWTHLIEEKLLFTTDHLTIIKLTEEAPYTSVFTPESPGKACNWIGYEIVSKYVERNNISLPELMNDNNHQRIFDRSRYKP